MTTKPLDMAGMILSVSKRTGLVVMNNVSFSTLFCVAPESLRSNFGLGNVEGNFTLFGLVVLYQLNN